MLQKANEVIMKRIKGKTATSTQSDFWQPFSQQNKTKKWAHLKRKESQKIIYGNVIKIMQARHKHAHISKENKTGIGKQDTNMYK